MEFWLIGPVIIVFVGVLMYRDGEKRQLEEAFIVWRHGTEFEKVLTKQDSFTLEQLGEFSDENFSTIIEAMEFEPLVIKAYMQMGAFIRAEDFEVELGPGEWRHYKTIRRSMRGYNFAGGLKQKVYRPFS